MNEYLLFAHWPIAHKALRPLVPSVLDFDEFEGSAWIGLTPFKLTGMRARLAPPIPGLSEFPEMNLRTYVHFRGKPGIFFFSLDADNALAVMGARMGYRLPYFRAEMSIERSGEWIHYRSQRSDETRAEFVGRYRPTGPIFEAERGSLAYFLAERYALFAVLSHGRVLCGNIHHLPWQLRSAEAEIERNTVTAAHGISLPDRSPLVHFTSRQDTLIWAPELAS